ncbi:putative repeat protein (TIGR03847 family) [Marmoricola sp. URHA0025 HA25]
MPPVVHRFDPPERFVAGTVGEPGQRTFFLQARDGLRITSVALEKQQVQILGERIDELLDELIAAGGIASLIPAITPVEQVDAGPLDQPIVEEFRAGTITLSWDAEDERIVVEVFPVVEVVIPIEADEDDLVDLPIDEPEPEELFIVRLTPTQARVFASRAASVVSAGRPPCQFCGGPVDPTGHLCPRANGFRRGLG